MISVLSAKLATQELNGEIDEALQTIGALRALQEKPDLKLTVGLFDEAILKARQTPNSTLGTVYEHAIESIYQEAVFCAPWDFVQDTVKSARNTACLLTEDSCSAERSKTCNRKSINPAVWIGVFLPPA